MSFDLDSQRAPSVGVGPAPPSFISSVPVLALGLAPAMLRDRAHLGVWPPHTRHPGRSSTPPRLDRRHRGRAQPDSWSSAAVSRGVAGTFIRAVARPGRFNQPTLPQPKPRQIMRGLLQWGHARLVPCSHSPSSPYATMRRARAEWAGPIFTYVHKLDAVERGNVSFWPRACPQSMGILAYGSDDRPPLRALLRRTLVLRSSISGALLAALGPVLLRRARLSCSAWPCVRSPPSCLFCVLRHGIRGAGRTLFPDRVAGRGRAPRSTCARAWAHRASGWRRLYRRGPSNPDLAYRVRSARRRSGGCWAPLSTCRSRDSATSRA